MGFYELNKQERAELASTIREDIYGDLRNGRFSKTFDYFSDTDTYIRKAAYLGTGRIFLADPGSALRIVAMLEDMLDKDDFRIRQTTINAAGEIGKTDFHLVRHFFDKGLFDGHHSVRNAVIGSVKKMGEVNPLPVFEWARLYLHHENKEIRREICHGIELRGRKYPQDILPMLKQLQHDKTARVRNTLVHVLGQIAYKKGCLETVVKDLESWENKDLVKDALEEIIDVHYRYRNFSYITQEDARTYIKLHFKPH
jgi:hypothetical protein